MAIMAVQHVMEMKRQIENLDAEMEELQKEFKRLGDQLIKEGENLSEGHTFFSNRFLLDKIDEAAEHFNRLAKTAEAIAGEIPGVQVGAKPKTMLQLRELFDLLHERMKELLYIEEKVDKARELVEISRSIDLKGSESKEELSALREKLDLYDEVLSKNLGDEEKEALALDITEGGHPLVSLWKLNEETLLLQEVKELFQKVKEEYGITLALAAVRGIFSLEGQNQKEEETSALQEGEEKLNSAAMPVELEKAEPVLGGEGIAKEDSIVEGQKDDPASAAEKKLIYTYQQLEETVLWLLNEEKFEPAFWIAYYCSQEYGEFSFPPLLLRALDLACVIESSNAPFTEALKEMYQELNIAEIPGRESSECRKRGLGLLAYSALLRPSYNAPETNAPFYMEKIDISPVLKEIQQALVQKDLKELNSEELKEIISFVDSAQQELKEIDLQCSKEDFLTSVAVKLCWRQLELLKKEVHKKKELSPVPPEEDCDGLIDPSHLELNIPWHPAPATVTNVAEALLDLLGSEVTEVSQKEEQENNKEERREIDFEKDLHSLMNLSAEEMNYIKKMIDGIGTNDNRMEDNDY